MTDDERPEAHDRDHTDDVVLRLSRWHADLLDDPQDGAARRAAAQDADPDAAAVFAALDQVRADLADAPDPVPPPGLLAGIDRALAAERTRDAGPSPVTTIRRTGSRRVLVAALAAVVVAGLVGAGISLGGGPQHRAGDPAPAPPIVAAPPAALPVVHRDDLPAALATGLGGPPAGVGGPLADPDRLIECLAAHGVAPTAAPIGMRRVVVDGAPAVLIVLPTGTAARFRVLVVGDGCSATTPLTVADSVVGR